MIAVTQKHPMTRTFASEIRARQVASFGAVQVVTRDQIAAVRDLRDALEHRLLTWSCAAGFFERARDQHETPTTYGDARDDKDPLIFAETLSRIFSEDTPTAVVAYDLDHWIESEPLMRRHLIEAAALARAAGHMLVLLSRSSRLHADLHDTVTTIEHALPDRDSAARVLTSLLTPPEGEAPLDVDRDAALDVMQGLTSTRQEDAIALAVAQAKLAGARVLDVGVMRRYKEEEIGRLDYLRVGEPTRGFADLVGHEYLKTWLRRRHTAFAPEAREAGVPVPKGMLLVGPPGTGKTRFAEATAAEWGLPFLTLDLASAFSSMLGESEENVANAIAIAERMAPCVLLIDEIESVIQDGKGGDLDGGTSSRVVGQLLSWTALKTSPVFLIATSNVATGLPPALIRKGRLDGVFAVDFATAQERVAIFRYYLDKAPHKVTEGELDECVEATRDWSGAEIEAAVAEARAAAFADGVLPDGQHLLAEIRRCVPVAQSMAAKVEEMRRWAKSYALSTTDAKQAPAAARKVEL